MLDETKTDSNDWYALVVQGKNTSTAEKERRAEEALQTPWFTHRSTK